MQKQISKWLIVIATTILIAALNVWFYHSFFLKKTFLFSWVLNFALFIWISVAESQLNPALKSAWYNSKPFEDKGRLYIKFGINLFRKFLVLIGWEKLTKATNPVKNDIEALQKYERATRTSEFNHIVVGLIVLAVTIYISLAHGIEKTVWMIVLNILLNLYPVMLQRFNRPRLRAMLARHGVNSI